MRISINPVQTSHGRRGPEGDRPSGSHEQHFLTEDQPAASNRLRTTEVGNSRLGTVFSHRRGLEGARTSSSHDRKTHRGSLHISPAPDHVPQKSEFPASALSSPIEEVWRAPGPPAPISIIFFVEVLSFASIPLVPENPYSPYFPAADL